MEGHSEKVGLIWWLLTLLTGDHKALDPLQAGPQSD